MSIDSKGLKSTDAKVVEIHSHSDAVRALEREQGYNRFTREVLLAIQLTNL